jgi:hypothetical protein
VIYFSQSDRPRHCGILAGHCSFVSAPTSAFLDVGFIWSDGLHSKLSEAVLRVVLDARPLFRTTFALFGVAIVFNLLVVYLLPSQNGRLTNAAVGIAFALAAVSTVALYRQSRRVPRGLTLRRFTRRPLTPTTDTVVSVPSLGGCPQLPTTADRVVIPMTSRPLRGVDWAC